MDQEVLRKQPKNYLNLQIYLHTEILSLLRECFAQEWENVTNSKWTNSQPEEKLFAQVFENFEGFKNTNAIQERKIRSGKSDSWDLSLLVLGLKALNEARVTLPNNKRNNATKAEYIRNLDTLTKIRNELSHLADLDISESKFHQKRKQIESAINGVKEQVARNKLSIGNDEEILSMNLEEKPENEQLSSSPQGFWSFLLQCFCG